MSDLNKVLLTGNLTRDPELRVTPKGMAVCNLSVASNREWKPAGGDVQQEATFVEVVAFGRPAEVIAEYLKKGRPIFLEGRLKLEQWEDKETGKPRQATKVVLESFKFMDSAPPQD